MATKKTPTKKNNKGDEDVVHEEGISVRFRPIEALHLVRVEEEEEEENKKE